MKEKAETKRGDEEDDVTKSYSPLRMRTMILQSHSSLV
jgi:hypothetical protein